MKIPFSYRQPHLFRSVLIASVFGHLAFLGVGSFSSGLPQFAVEQAPRSMEVVIVKKAAAEKKLEEIKFLSWDKNLKEVPVKEHKDRKEIEKSVYVPPQKGAVTEAKPAYLKNPAPVYPELARERGWEGTVVLKVLVAKDGRVMDVSVDQSSGHEVLDEAALKAIRTWQFLPARVGNLSFSSWVKIPVRFVLIDEKGN